MSLVFSEICRLCLGSTELAVSLFHNNLQLKIRNISPSLQVEEGDGLPDQVCQQCLDQVNTSYNFKLQCERSDATLRHCLKETVLQNGAARKQVETSSTNTDKPKPALSNSHHVTEDASEDKVCVKKEDEHENHVNDAVYQHDSSEEEGSDQGETRVAKKSPAEENPCAVKQEASQNSNRVRKKVRSSSRTFTCEICNIRLTNPLHYKEHQANHQGEKLHHCAQCGKSFTWTSSYRKHMRTHVTGQQNAPAPAPKKTHWCHICGRGFTGSSNLNNHLTVHSGEKRFTCEICGKMSSTKEALKKHSIVHSDERPFECGDCGKRFKEKSVLTVHSYSHRGEKRYGCQLCGKRFSQKNSLKYHLFSHSGERRHECRTCGKAFILAKELRRHEAVHLGVRPAAPPRKKTQWCEVCGKGFPSASHLAKHIPLHTGERPYGCDYCGRRFAQRGHLQEHTRTHTGERPFICKLCSRCYVSNASLKKHLKTHGPDEQRTSLPAPQPKLV